MNNKQQQYDVSLRCQYPNGDCTHHRQLLQLKEIPKWIEAYHFTHPEVKSISIKVWLTDLKINTQNDTINAKEEAQKRLIQKAINATK